MGEWYNDIVILFVYFELSEYSPQWLNQFVILPTVTVGSPVKKYSLAFFSVIFLILENISSSTNRTEKIETPHIKE